ncbi:MAG: uroporphyrinogen-III synthase [Caulobacterales bacterium]
MARAVSKLILKAVHGPRTVWVTRTQPAAGATAARVRALGLEAVVEPLLLVRPLKDVSIDLEGVCAIVFTSANAVRAFAERSPARALRVFAVGDATAEATRAARFASVLSAQGDVKALAAALAARKRELPGVILHPSTTEPAADLVGALSAVGLEVRPAPLYETVEVEPSAALIERLPAIDHVLLHSPKAARVLAKFVKRHPAPHLVALALSREVARPLAKSGLAGVRSAAAPTEASLLALLSHSDAN